MITNEQTKEEVAKMVWGMDINKQIIVITDKDGDTKRNSKILVKELSKGETNYEWIMTYYYFYEGEFNYFKDKMECWSANIRAYNWSLSDNIDEIEELKRKIMLYNMENA